MEAIEQLCGFVSVITAMIAGVLTLIAINAYIKGNEKQYKYAYGNAKWFATVAIAALILELAYTYIYKETANSITQISSKEKTKTKQVSKQ